jgi:ribonuclease E
MSRQRIRTGVLESTTTTCPVCHGTGHIRAPASVALHVLRSLEDQLLRGVTHNLTIRTRTAVALYILNQKRAHLSELEQRFGLTIAVMADETITNGAHFILERGDPVTPREAIIPPIAPATVQPEMEPEDIEVEAELEAEEDEDDERSEADERGERGDRQPHGDRGDHGQRGEDGGRRRRRRRRRRGGGEQRQPGEGQPMAAHNDPMSRSGDMSEPGGGFDRQGRRPQHHAGELDENGQPRRRRRGRRGGRRGRGGQGGDRPQPNGEQPRYQERAFGDQDAARHERHSPNGSETMRSEPAPSTDEQPRSEPVPVYRMDPIPEARPEPRPEPEQQFKRADRPMEQPAPSEPSEKPEEADDPNRPKRGGWWQRRSFF